MAAEVLRDVLPAFRGLGRPLLKATVKSGLMLAQDSRLMLAEFRQVLTEVAAEVKIDWPGRNPKFLPSDRAPRRPGPQPERCRAAVTARGSTT